MEEVLMYLLGTRVILGLVRLLLPTILIADTRYITSTARMAILGPGTTNVFVLLVDDQLNVLHSPLELVGKADTTAAHAHEDDLHLSLGSHQILPNAVFLVYTRGYADSIGRHTV